MIFDILSNFFIKIKLKKIDAESIQEAHYSYQAFLQRV
jgi:hypothetical protein